MNKEVAQKNRSVVLSDLMDLKDSMNKRFDAIDARLDGHDAQFVSIEKRFEVVDQKFVDLTELMVGGFDRVYDEMCSMELRLMKSPFANGK